MRTLIVDSMIWLFDRLVEKGYVLIDNTIVKELGEGEPPPEAQLVDNIVGGEGRIVLPSPLTPLMAPEAYAIRHFLADTNSFKEIIHVLAKVFRLVGDEASYYSSLMAFAEASLLGFSGGVFIAVNVEAVAKALSDSGLWGIVLGLACSHNPSQELAGAEQYRVPGRVLLGIATCSREEAENLQRELASKGVSVEATAIVGDRAVEVILNKGSYTLHAVRLWVKHLIMAVTSPWLMANRWIWDRDALEARRLVFEDIHQAAFGHKPLVRGSPANIVIIDASEPPLLVTKNVEGLLDYLSTSTPRVETVFVTGTPIVDGHQHLFVGAEASAKARQVFEDSWEKMKEALKN